MFWYLGDMEDSSLTNHTIFASVVIKLNAKFCSYLRSINLRYSTFKWMQGIKSSPYYLYSTANNKWWQVLICATPTHQIMASYKQMQSLWSQMSSIWFYKVLIWSTDCKMIAWILMRAQCGLLLVGKESNFAWGYILMRGLDLAPDLKIIIEIAIPHGITDEPQNTWNTTTPLDMKRKFY